MDITIHIDNAIKAMESLKAALTKLEQDSPNAFDQRPYIPGIGKDAKKLGVSRQFLSRVLHDPERYGHYQIYKDYHALKANKR